MKNLEVAILQQFACMLRDHAVVMANTQGPQKNTSWERDHKQRETEQALRDMDDRCKVITQCAERLTNE